MQGLSFSRKDSSKTTATNLCCAVNVLSAGESGHLTRQNTDMKVGDIISHRKEEPFEKRAFSASSIFAQASKILNSKIIA